MTIWIFLAAIFVAGCVGGTVNALMSDNGFTWPRWTGGIAQPGWLGNAFIGGVAAVVSWGLYGPFADASLFSRAGPPLPTARFTLAALVGAILVGISGARWLSNEADKKILRRVGIEAAKRIPDPALVGTLTTASPAAAFHAIHAAPVGPNFRSPNP